MNTIKLKLVLFLYNCWVVVIILLYLIFLLFTFRLQKLHYFIKNNFRFNKLNLLQNINKDKSNIWIHAASVGESILLFPIVKELLIREPDYSIIITTCTDSSKNLWTKEFGSKIKHFYLPWDLAFFSKKFIKLISPKLAIFVESDFWPTYLFNLQHKKIPVILLNGRMSEKSFKRWKKIKFFTKNLLNVFSVITTDSLISLERLRCFVDSKKIKYWGNLKYIPQSNSMCNKDEIVSTRQFLQNKTIILALSTHFPEEKMFGSLHLELKNMISNLLTIIVPRHADRSKNILTLLKKTNLKCELFSQINNVNENTDLLIVNVFGKTSLFLNFSHIVYIGKSMFKNAQGGHNLLEPMQKGNPIIFGPYMNNFLEIAEKSINGNAAVQVNNPTELKESLIKILKDPYKLQKMRENSKTISNQDMQVKENSIQLIKSFLHI